MYADAGTCAPVRTAALHGGSAACVTAARHRGLWTVAAAEEIHVWLGNGGHAYDHGDCRCRPHWDDAAEDVLAPLPLPLVLRQILGCRGVEEFFVAVESALRQKLLATADIDWLRRNTNGAGRDALSFARSDSDSGLESIVRWRLRRWNIPVRTQVGIVSVGRVDLLIGDTLIVEIDGAEYHDGASHRHRDLVRDAHAAIWGFITLRFDYALIMHDWETVERAILAHVDRRRHVAP